MDPSNKAGADRFPVAVTWQAGSDRPEPAGLNWLGAGAIAAAGAAAGEPDAAIVWIPADVSVLLTGPERAQKVTPVATDDELAVMKLARKPVAVADYSTGLHSRIRSFVADGKAVPQAGGGGPAPVLDGSAVDPAQLPVGRPDQHLLGLTTGRDQADPFA